jgi:D-glycero-alpha-D-manno-heptose 1-phosphate guanylyltransferase
MPSVPDALLLCGGAGLRLRSITGGAPKGMANVAGRPFLELLIRQLRRHGFERVILAVGYRKDVIRSHFGERAFGLRLAYSSESSPLGTGGALRNAVELVRSESILIMNGDSYTDVDLGELVADYQETQAHASVVVVPADGRGDCGSVLLDGEGKLVGFEEKGPFRASYINAGIYAVSRQLLCEIPAGVEVSLEQELLPQWLRQGKYIKGFVCWGRCVDIGTPERYRSAQDLLANAEVTPAQIQYEGQL